MAIRPGKTRVGGPARVVWRRLAPWPVVAVVGAVASLLVDALICLCLPMIGWLGATDLPLSDPVGLAVGLLLLAHGAPLTIEGVVISVVPLGLTLVMVAVGLGVTRVGLRHGFAASPGASTRRVAGVAATVAVAYAAVIAVVTVLVEPESIVRAVIGGLVVGLIVGWSAAAPLFGWRIQWPDGAPAWVRALPRAMGAALGVLAAVAALVLCIALVASRARIGSLQDGLDAGTLGGVLLAIMQAMWLPNFLLWCASWLVGAGFAVGIGTVVSPVAVEAGILPSLPVFGTVPPDGAPSPFTLIWLAAPVAAGVAGAWVALRAQVTSAKVTGEPMRADIGALIGGATGILAGLLITGLAGLSIGDFGSVRMVGLGPRLGPMVLLATTLFGFAGLLAGLMLAWRAGGAEAFPQPPSGAPGGHERIG